MLVCRGIGATCWPFGHDVVMATKFCTQLLARSAVLMRRREDVMWVGSDRRINTFSVRSRATKLQLKLNYAQCTVCTSTLA